MAHDYLLESSLDPFFLKMSSCWGQSSDIIRKSWKVEEDTGGALLKLSKENNSAKVIITVDVNTQVTYLLLTTMLAEAEAYI